MAHNAERRTQNAECIAHNVKKAEGLLLVLVLSYG